jgi:DNA replication protein DnaC
MPCLGLPGIWNWLENKSDRLGDQKTLHPDFDLIPHVAGREMIMIYDSDATEPAKATNFDACARAFAAALSTRKVKLYRFDMPSVNSDRKTGLDDYLVQLPSDRAKEEDFFDGDWAISKMAVLLRTIREKKRIVRTDSSLCEILDTNITSIDEFLKKNISRPRRFWAPWLTEGSVTIIYGKAGIGKTWLNIILALGLTRKNFENIEIGKWQVKETVGVMYIDGEMHPAEMQERLRQLMGTMGEGDPNVPFYFVSSSQLYQTYEKMINLSNEESREELLDFLRKHPEYKCLILDNIASLFPGLDENSKREWDNANQWLVRLRAMGLAVVLVHHAGKGNDPSPRGTSGRSDNVDTIINISRPKGRTSAEGAVFEIHFEKNRNLRPDEVKPFRISIIEDPDHPGCLKWEVSDATKKAETKMAIMYCLLNGEANGDNHPEPPRSHPPLRLYSKRHPRNRMPLPN